MGNIYKNELLDLTTTNVITLHTTPAATTSIFKSILISNDSSSADTITLTLTLGTAVFSIFKNEEVGALSTKELLLQPLVVSEGQILKVTAAAANRLHVVASILELT